MIIKSFPCILVYLFFFASPYTVTQPKKISKHISDLTSRSRDIIPRCELIKRTHQPSHNNIHTSRKNEDQMNPATYKVYFDMQV